MCDVGLGFNCLQIVRDIAFLATCVEGKLMQSRGFSMYAPGILKIAYAFGITVV